MADENQNQQQGNKPTAEHFDVDAFLKEHGSKTVNIKADGVDQEVSLSDVFTKHAPGGLHFTKDAQFIADLKKIGASTKDIEEAYRAKERQDIEEWLNTEEGEAWILSQAEERKPKGKKETQTEQPTETMTDKELKELAEDNPTLANKIKEILAKQGELEQKVGTDVKKQISEELQKFREMEQREAVAKEEKILRSKYPDLTDSQIKKVRQLASLAVDSADEGSKDFPTLLETFEENKTLFIQPEKVDLDKIRAEEKAKLLKEMSGKKEEMVVEGSGNTTTNEPPPKDYDEYYKKLAEKGINLAPPSSFQKKQ